MSINEFDPDDAPKIWDENTVIAITQFEYEKAERGGPYQPPSDANVTVITAHIKSTQNDSLELRYHEWTKCNDKFINKLNIDHGWHVRVWEALDSHEGGE